MPPKSLAIARWTGRGSLAALRSSVGFLMHSSGQPGRVTSVGDSVVVEASDPLRAASTLAYMPGVAWVAVGLAFSSMKDAGRTAGGLAEKYLKRGDRFSVDGEGRGSVVGADVAGAVTSGILDAVKGARVSESAQVRFRAAYDTAKGVVGVEVRKGPGGISTGEEWANCLVSGGMHSSVVAWYALLMGYRVRLVHVRSGEGSVLAAASLYAELSHRVDPRALKLEVVEGATPQSLAERLGGTGAESFGGFRSAGPKPPKGLRKRVGAPLFLLPEEQFLAAFKPLCVKADENETSWNAPPGAKLSVRTFVGWAADVSAVLDGLR